MDSRELDALDSAVLLERGRTAARVGDVEEARTYLAALTEREPDNADAWLWLAGLDHDPRRKRDHFRKALKIRPSDAEAKAGLERLAEKHGASILEDEAAADVFVCTWHPERETLLRCSRCKRPMCTQCSVRHPVGMRCKECVRELRSPVYVMGPAQLALGAVTALAASTVAGVFFLAVSRIPFAAWIIAFVAGTAVGAGIADLASRSAGRKRGRELAIVVAVAMVVGASLASVAAWVGSAAAAAGPGAAAQALGGAFVRLAIAPFMNIAMLIYLAVGIRAAFARLR